MTVTVNPGVILLINSKEVVLTPKDLTDAKTKGVHFELADKVDLGTLADANTLLNGTFGVSAPDGTNLPSPLNTMLDFKNIHLTIENFILDVPPNDAGGKAGTMTFTAGISATLTAPQSIIPGALAISGVYLQITKDAQTT